MCECKYTLKLEKMKVYEYANVSGCGCIFDSDCGRRCGCECVRRMKWVWVL